MLKSGWSGPFHWLGCLFAPGSDLLRKSVLETLLVVSVDENENRVTELFDKYNVLTLPVVDKERRLAGVITADDIISVLRHK
jgi:Mg/Co/Ni transporter MgtE